MMESFWLRNQLFRNEIQELMKQNAGIIREGTRLQNGLNRILELKEEFYS